MDNSKGQLEAARNFRSADLSDCPVLTDERPCHIVAKPPMSPPRIGSLNMRVVAGVPAAESRKGGNPE